MPTLDLLSCYNTTPPKIEMVLPGLPIATVGSIVSPGGTGKSMLAIQLAHYVAAGIDTINLGAPSGTGRVLIFSCEDNETILHSRFHAFGSLLSPEERRKCAANIDVVDLTATEPNIMSSDWFLEIWEAIEASDATEIPLGDSMTADERLEFTKAYFEQRYQERGEARKASGIGVLKEPLITDLYRKPRARLVILDTLRAFHQADENNAGEMSQVISRLRMLANLTNAAIVFLHHTSKGLAVSGQGDLQQASRGSSVLTDNIRWQAFLSGMSKEESQKMSARTDGKPIGEDYRRQYVRYGISKQNYGAPEQERWLYRRDGGILEPVHLKPAASNKTTHNRIGAIAHEA